MTKATPQLSLFREVRFELPAPVRRVFRRRKRVLPSEWAQRHVYLPKDVTSRSGYWRPELTPYSPAVMDTWADAWVRKVVFAAGPQTGKTLTAYLPHLYALDRAPGPVFAAMAGQDGARKMSSDYFQPILKASPTLRQYLTKNPDDLANYRMKFANGMRIYSAWVSSPLMLKSFPARYGLADEVDDWYQQASYADDPEALFEVRLRTYPFTSKLILVSSPGDYSRGIWPKLMGCQVVYVWKVPCPRCGLAQRLTWPPKGSPFYPRVVWEGGSGADPSRVEGERLARYHCAGCGDAWNDRARHAAIGRGRFEPVEKRYLTPEADAWHDPLPEPPAEIPARPVSVGFHVPALASRLVFLGQAARSFLEANAEGDPVERKKRLKTWVNSFPALPWVDAPPAARAESELLELRDDRPADLVPDGALLLILTADVQEAGIWYEVRAWGTHRTSWLVRYGFLARGLEGPPAADLPAGFPRAADFVALRSVLLGPYREADGTEHQPWLGLVDCRWRGVEVFDFCRTVGRAHPCMGYETLRALPVKVTLQKTYPGTSRALLGQIFRVDVDTNRLKDALADRLRVARGELGAWNLHAETGADYVQHYRGEARDPVKGVWQQRGGQPNHLWDCGVYQLAAVQVLEGQRVFERVAEAARRPAGPAPGAPLPRLFRERASLG